MRPIFRLAEINVFDDETIEQRGDTPVNFHRPTAHGRPGKAQCPKNLFSCGALVRRLFCAHRWLYEEGFSNLNTRGHCWS
jgi:hypothetical protein